MVPRVKYIALLLFLTLLAAFAPSVSCEELGPEKIMAFADYLYAQGDYYRAITEYERVVFLFSDHPLAKTARFQVAMSYLQGDKLEQAIQRFQKCIDTYPKEEISVNSLFMLAEAYSRKKSYDLAINTLGRFITLYPDHAQADAARIKLGFIYLKKGDWLRASEEFHKLPADSALRQTGEGLAEEAKKMPALPKKSPALAGVLSAVLPGVGQLYDERYADAGVSFLLNGSFIWGAAEAFHNHNNVTAGILLLFESGWYMGNIYNAANSAYKYNQRTDRDFLDSLGHKYGISMSEDSAGGKKFFAFTMTF